MRERAAAPAAVERRSARGRRGSGLDVRPGSIREARQQAGVTMAQVAGSDLTRGAIYLFETGRARPSRPALELIAARTRKPLSFFLGSEPSDVAAAAAGSQAALAGALASSQPQRALDLAAGMLEVGVDQAAEARIRLAMARAVMALGRPEAGVMSARQARELAAGDAWLEAEARVVESQALHDADDPAALEVATEALAAVRALEPRPPWLSEQLLHLVGAIHVRRGEWAAAAAAHAEVVERRPDAAALQETVAALEARVEGLAGDRRGGEAAAAHWQAVALRSVGDQMALALRSAVELGAAQAELGELDRAADTLAKAVGFGETLGLQRERCEAQVRLAGLWLRRGAPPEAMEQAERALVLAEEIGDRRCVGLAHLLRARLAVREGDPEGAEAEFRAACASLEEAVSPDDLVEARGAYAEMLEANGRVQEALEQWKRTTGLIRPDLRQRLGLE